MSATSKIEWTEATWNPLVGCTKVSPGCDHCYAETLVNRFAGKNSGFPNRFDVVTLRGEKMLTQPLRWRARKRIFVNSLSDLFHKDVPLEFIAEVWAVMAIADQHTYQLLTKRPGRARSVLDSGRFHGLVEAAIERRDPDFAVGPGIVLDNVWQGVSVESADQLFRVDTLRDTPAAVRWISAEPLLGPLDGLDLTGIDWVVAGGESGPGARPMHPGWARALRDQCVAAEVPFLFKQWGEHVTRDQMTEAVAADWDIKHGNDAYHADVQWRVGKKAAGRELDGRTWDEYPPVSA